MTTFQPGFSSGSGGPVPDGFHRQLFARQLAETILGRPGWESAVIGIYGAPGEGKTTALAYLGDHLNARPEVLLMSFKPGHFSNSEEMRSGLLTAISVEMAFHRTPGDPAGLPLSPLLSLMPAYASGLAQRDRDGQEGREEPGAGCVSSPVVDRTFLSRLKAELGKLFVQRGLHVVVLVDDLDRCPFPDTREFLQFVSADADFPTVTYVLAVDPEMVARAIGGQASSSEEDVRAVLAPLIHRQCPLPRLDRWSITDVLSARLTGILSGLGKELTPDQEVRLQTALWDGVAPGLRTPRQIERYLRAVQFAAPTLLGETDPVDVFLIEALRVQAPALFRTVRDQGHSFLFPLPEQDRPDFIRERLDDVLRGCSVEAVQLLRALFPQVDRALGGTEDLEDHRPYGISRLRYFPRYVRLAGSRAHVPDRVVDQWFRQVTAFPVAADRFLRALAPTAFAFNLMLGIRDALPVADPVTQRAVLLALARFMPVFMPELGRPGLRNPAHALLETLVISLCRAAEDRGPLHQEVFALLPDEAASHLRNGLERAAQIRGPGRSDSSPNPFGAAPAGSTNDRRQVMRKTRGHA